MNTAPAETDPPSVQQPTAGSLVVIFLTVFIDLLGFGIVLPLLPIYADLFGTDSSGIVIGMLMASFSMMQFLFAPVWGGLSDRIGRRPVILIGLSGSAFFYLMFAVSAWYASLVGLFLTRIGAGIAGATIPTAQAYIADTTTPENRARGMALIGVAFGMGFTLGPMFAFFAVPTGAGDPGAGPGLVAAALSAAALGLAWFYLPESLQPSSQPASRRWLDISAWRDAWQSTAMRWLLLGFFLCIFAFASFETTLSLLIKGSSHFERSPFTFSFRQVCLTFALIGLLVAVVQGGIVRRLTKTIAEPTLAIAGALIEVVGFCVLAVGVQQASLTGLFVALAIIVVGYSCMQPSLYSLISRWSDPRRQGRALGVSQSVSAVARILGSALGIPMLMAGLQVPYFASAGLMLLVGLAVGWACRTGRDFTPTPDQPPVESAED